MSELVETGAFEQALLDAIAHPGRHICFEYRSLSGTRWECPADQYLRVRDQEREILEHALEDLKPHSRILDIGCGVGRHLKICRELLPEAELWGIEEALGFRAHCEHALPGSRYLANLNDLDPDEHFDLILLMGNGLGIFGDEEITRRALAHLYDRLRPGGALVMESGQVPLDDTFRVEDILILYQGKLDGPLTWNFAPLDWVHSELERCRFQVVEILPVSKFAGYHLTRALRGD